MAIVARQFIVNKCSLFIKRCVVIRFDMCLSTKSYDNPSSLVEKNSKDLRTETSEILPDTNKAGGFARAFEKFTSSNQIDPKQSEPEDVSFLSLLKQSKFIDLGDPENKIVVGSIFHVVGHDLYIDFGGKFHCVCPCPAKNQSAYVRGAKVRLRLQDLEMSTRFLGSERDMTLLEAKATLLGIVSSPAART